VVVAVGALVILTGLYVLVDDATASPISVFALPAVLLASFASPRETAFAGALSVVIAVVMGSLVSDLSSAAVVTRVAVVAAAVVAAVVVSSRRARREARVRDLMASNLVLETLQRRLAALPIVPPGISIDFRYVPAESRLNIGGDFMEAITLPDGSLGFVLGDVSGHGPDAAAFGVVVRAGWKAIALSSPPDPVLWLETLERSFFEDHRFHGFATALTGVVRPGDPLVRIASAGHCRPIRVGERVCDEVPTATRPPLGVPGGRRAVLTEIRLGRGERVLMYTDGLVENHRSRSSAARWSEEDLLAWLRDRGRTDGGVDLDELLAAFGSHGFDDDVAVLVVDPVGGPG
jgi:serine phosphatase RsbU (regulator of sigma subunit)